MSMPNVPAEDALPEGVDPVPDSPDAPAPDGGEPEYGTLTVEDDPEGTVDPGELAGGANEDDEDVS